MRVAALIVTFNRLTQLKRSLTCTLSMMFHSITVVNNASTDGTAAWLATQDDPRLNVVNLSANTGGAGGFHAGLAYLAEQPEWTHLCLFDDDAWPESNWLEAFAREPAADIYCSNVRDLHQQPCMMNLPFTRLPETLHQTLHYYFHPENYRPADYACDVVSLSFVGACITRQWLSALQHALVPELFIYYDDLSAGVALSRMGARLRWSPMLLFNHAVNPQANIAPFKIYFMARNLLWLKRLPAGALWTPAVTVLRLGHQLINILRSDDPLSGLRAWGKGIMDGIRKV